jgi:hypothetical protein
MTFHGSDIRQPIVIGRVPASELGALLNVVERPTFPCPECDIRGPLAVYVPAVRWPCGHTRSLPPLKATFKAAGAVVYLRDYKGVA